METVSLKTSNLSSKKIKQHDTSKILNEFTENRFVEVMGFLESETALKYQNFYYNEMPEDWFVLSTYPNFREGENNALMIKSWEKELKAQAFPIAEKTFNNGDFAYHFHRTINDHSDKCYCTECEIREFFVSNEMLDFLCEATGKHITKESGHFTSWYKKGDFLSCHHDEGNGSIAVILDFAKNWNPVFGGNLHLLEEDWVETKKVIVPKLNNLKIFDIPENRNGVPHFVSTVVANDIPQRKRIAFGGWYK